jgi:hypothetical protein
MSLAGPANSIIKRFEDPATSLLDAAMGFLADSGSMNAARGILRNIAVYNSNVTWVLRNVADGMMRQELVQAMVDTSMICYAAQTVVGMPLHLLAMRSEAYTLAESRLRDMELLHPLLQGVDVRKMLRRAFFRACDFCGDGGELDMVLKACGRCRKTYYCNKACQSAHWRKGHKNVCEERV